jgi:hypothetical protein
MDLPVVVGSRHAFGLSDRECQQCFDAQGVCSDMDDGLLGGGHCGFPNHQQHQKSCTRTWFRGSMRACMGLPEHYFIFYQTIHHHAHEIILRSTFII